MSAAPHGLQRSKRAKQPASEDVTLDIPVRAPVVAEPALPAVAVLSADEQLRTVIASSLDSQRLVAAASLEELSGLCAAEACGIVVTDQATAAQCVKIAEQLRAFDSALVLIAVGKRGEDNALVGMLSRGVIDRMMIKPVTPALSRIVLESAMREYGARKTQGGEADIAPNSRRAVQRAEPMTVASPPREVDEESPAVDVQAAGVHARDVDSTIAALDESPASQSWPKQLVVQRQPVRTAPVGYPWLGLAAVVAIVGVLIWWLTSGQFAGSSSQQALEDSLAQAEAAHERGDLIEPAQQSALHYYNAALALDPDNTKAKAGVDEVVAALIERADRLIGEAKFAAAVAVLQDVRRLRPDDDRVAALDARVTDALKAQLASSAAPAAAAPSKPVPVSPVRKDVATAGQEIKVALAPSRNVSAAGPESRTAGDVRAAAPAAPPSDFSNDELLQLVLLRITQNRLFEPEDDSANHYLERIRRKDPGFPGLERAKLAFGQRLVIHALLATEAKDFERAERTLAQARSLGFVGVYLESAESALRVARNSPRPTPPEPVASVAAPVPQPAAPPPAVWEPKLLRRVPPEYPAEARFRNVEGWVDLSFRVTDRGEVVDAQIEDSNRRQMFGRPALNAVKQWKYQPRPDNVPAPAGRFTVRVQFQIDRGGDQQRTAAE